MILKASQRANGQNLAVHLMRVDDNEHVSLHQLRGFASDTLKDAFKEAEAISLGTKCKQYLFSLSLNPPKEESVDPRSFEDAVNRAEATLGLAGQPRAIVFHEKRGMDGKVRRHAHAVWCRIDAENARAVQLSFTKRKLQDLGRELYLEHGWKMPRGFVRSQETNPRNYSLAEWQQAKRAKKEPDKLKAMFQDCWAVSDSQTTLAHALKEHGYILARGDRRGVVALDHRGEVYAISRWVGIKTKDLRARIDRPEALPDTGQAHAQAAKIVTDRLREVQEQERRVARERLERLRAQESARKAREREEALRLRKAQLERAQAEMQERAARVRKGVKGLLDRLTGKRKRTLELNRLEEERSVKRDQQELSAFTQRQQATKTAIQARATETKSRAKQTLRELSEDIQRLEQSPQRDPSKDADREVFKATRREQAERPKRRRARDGPRPGR